MRLAYGQLLPPLPRLALEGGVLVAVYLGMLLFVAGEKSFYLDLLRTLRGSSSTPKETLMTTHGSSVPLLLLNPDE